MGQSCINSEYICSGAGPNSRLLSTQTAFDSPESLEIKLKRFTGAPKGENHTQFQPSLSI